MYIIILLDYKFKLKRSQIFYINKSVNVLTDERYLILKYWGSMEYRSFSTNMKYIHVYVTKY